MSEVGFYAHRILPRLIDLGMRQSRLVPLREHLIALAAGRILEVGIGSGLNLPFYRRDIEGVIGVDPSPELLARARRNAAWTHFPVQLLEGRAEALPVEDGAVDSVVMTWTLCSVDDPLRALAEIRRALRPGGSLIFIEHGRAPEPRIQRWQDRLNPCWSRFAGGCNLNRPVDALLRSAGLRLVGLETGYLVKGPKPWTFHYRGQASV